jgi:hypothetical protein
VYVRELKDPDGTIFEEHISLGLIKEPAALKTQFKKEPKRAPPADTPKPKVRAARCLGTSREV